MNDSYFEEMMQNEMFTYIDNPVMIRMTTYPEPQQEEMFAYIDECIKISVSNVKQVLLERSVSPDLPTILPYFEPPCELAKELGIHLWNSVFTDDFDTEIMQKEMSMYDNDDTKPNGDSEYLFMHYDAVEKQRQKELELKREKNKLAARKKRAKYKNTVIELLQKLKDLEKNNNEIKIELQRIEFIKKRGGLPSLKA